MIFYMLTLDPKQSQSPNVALIVDGWGKTKNPPFCKYHSRCYHESIYLEWCWIPHHYPTLFYLQNLW